MEIAVDTDDAEHNVDIPKEPQQQDVLIDKDESATPDPTEALSKGNYQKALKEPQTFSARRCDNCDN